MQMVDAMGGNYKRHLEYLFYALDPADPNQVSGSDAGHIIDCGHPKNRRNLFFIF